MFTVKGWAVDSSALKPQTELHKATLGSTPDEISRPGKKRKRGTGAPAESQDVGALWERHIEGKKPVKSEKQTKTGVKKQKLERKADNVSHSDGIKPVQVTPVDKKENLANENTSEGKRKKRAEKDHLQKNHKADTDGKDGIRGDRKSTKSPAKTTSADLKLTPMQAAMRQKLVSARFRHLNQTLYTESSVKALELFDHSPDMFEDYHSGFRQQVSIWPENPVDSFLATIRTRGKVRLTSQKKAFKDKRKSSDTSAASSVRDGSVVALPRMQGTCIIADLGCGDARLAQTIKDTGDGQTLNVKILSYDLHSPSKYVTKADISNVPTPDSSVNVAIFCLALMGTNWISFIEEAYRILHWKGELWIAEIKSRFGRVPRPGKAVEHSVGGKRKQAALKKVQEAKKREQQDVNEQETLAVEVDGAENQNQETDVSAFVEVLNRRGFVLKNGESSIDLSNRMFVRMEFLKAATPTKGKAATEPDAQPAVTKFKAKAKFLDGDKDDVASEDEARVLKPCLYKIR